jgi:hypothetical protein
MRGERPTSPSTTTHTVVERAAAGAGADAAKPAPRLPLPPRLRDTGDARGEPEPDLERLKRIARIVSAMIQANSLSPVKYCADLKTVRLMTDLRLCL